MAVVYRHIQVTREKGVFAVRLRRRHLDEMDIVELADELMALIKEEGCRKLALALGPGRLECLYSVFLAKLVMVRRSLTEHGGKLILCEATPETVAIFEACHLKDYFDFQPDMAAATTALVT
jgi:anti-anti-sigma factor